MEKELTSKNFIKKYATFAILLLILCAAIVLIFDPYFHYHKPLPFLKAVLWEKEYQVPGSIDHLDYDAIIVGSSEAENYNNNWFTENFGCHPVKAIRSYGGVADLCYFLSRAFENRELKYVFYNLDVPTLAEADTTTFIQTGAPLYMYDKNPFNDVEYLFNKDVILEKIPYSAATSLVGDYDEGESYNWWQWKTFSETGALSNYFQHCGFKAPKAADAGHDAVLKNIKLFTDIVEAHPDTQFYFFLPPYSILYWDNIFRSGETEYYLYNEELVMKSLLKYDNVRIFNFQTEKDIVFNLDNYMDALHFSKDINHYLCNCLMDGTCELKSENEITESVDKVREYALTASDYVSQNYEGRIIQETE